jgi:hypothetical protein
MNPAKPASEGIAARTAATASAVPTRVGKYPIRCELGRGASSHVYLGRDTFANRDVAIKVLNKDPAASQPDRHRYGRMFLNEASLVGKLNHPNIIGIYDAGVEDDFSYIVMELVNGGTLDPYCDVDALLPLERVVEIGFKCGLALEFASRSGIIHRDIKPANILVGDNGDIKVSDFGAALQSNADLTQLKGVGSPLYMSPEQAQDLPLTHQTDIYSLGVVMYRLLTGKPPFVASNNTSLLYQIVHLDAPAPGVHRPDLPTELELIVMTAMARDPGRRYRTWEEFCTALAGINKALALPAASISDTEKYGAIKAVPFFRDFAHLDVWEMVRIAAFRRVPAGEILVRQGQVCESFFLIADGQARVTAGGEVLSVLGDGDCFGEIPYFEDRGPRTSAVEAITPLTVIEVNAEALKRSSDACQKQFNRAFVRVLLDRIDRLSKLNAHLRQTLRGNG